MIRNDCMFKPQRPAMGNTRQIFLPNGITAPVSLVPVLQLDDISLGVGEIVQRQATGAGDVDGLDLTKFGTAMSEHFYALLFHVINLKSNMGKARQVGGSFWWRRILAIFENFEGRSVFTETGQSQMHSHDGRAFQSGQRFDMRAVVITFSADRLAVKDVAIESDYLLPVVGD
jgi:hypothetical protein